MTSLQFFPPNDSPPQIPCDWGTGKSCKAVVGPPDDHTPPSWHYTNAPPEEPVYQVSRLQLSNNRPNDELIPRPEHFDASKVVIRKPFPAEHPYSSHISRFAVFPCSSTQRNVNDEEGRANPQVIVLQKAKGFGARVEKLVGINRNFSWPENESNHIPKGTGPPRRSSYPIPPKLFLPNDDLRRSKVDEPEEMDSREKQRGRRAVADAIAEAEQKKWLTTYRSSNLDITDQWQERKKEASLLLSDGGQQTGDVTMRNGVEMMIQNGHGMNTQQQLSPYNSCPRKLTFNEREEHRLLNGTTYVNYPDNVHPSCLDPCYNYPLPQLHQFSTLHECGRCPEVVEKPVKPKEDPYHLLIKQQHETVQQVEARNRWRLLESQTPSHDLGALRRKMDISSSKHQPEVFYGHEGRYQRERAGIYRTSYDPAALKYAMNRLDRCGAALTDTSSSHKNVLDLPTDLNDQMAEIIRYNRSLCGSVAQPHSQPSQFEVYGPFEAAKALQKLHLTPDGSQADIRTQEGDVIWKQTTYGADYNIPKFLQDHPPVPLHSRAEPLEVMSHRNQIIANIPLSCPTVCPRPYTSPSDRKDLSDYPASVARVLNSTAFHARQKEEIERMGPVCLSGGIARPQTTAGGPLPTLPCPPQHYDLSYRLSARLHEPSYSCRGDTKTEIREKFEHCFPSRTPDLRENAVCQGKKHNFQCGINGQVLRGMTVVTAG